MYTSFKTVNNRGEYICGDIDISFKRTLKEYGKNNNFLNVLGTFLNGAADFYHEYNAGKESNNKRVNTYKPSRSRYKKA